MPMHLETNLSAKFIMTNEAMTQGQEASLRALNAHTEEVTEILQPVFRLLITEMLELKRKQFTKEEHHAGPEQIDLSSNDGTDC